MAYAEGNWKSGAALKRAVKDGKKIGCYQPGLGPNLDNFTGDVCLEGPSYKPHTWYVKATLKEGIIIKVK